MKSILWVITIMGAIVGAFTLFSTLMNANSAPQEAAGAAVAVAFVVIPYCMSKAVTELSKKE